MSGICGVAFADERQARAVDVGPMLRALGDGVESEHRIVAAGPVALGAHAFPGRAAGVAEMSLGADSLVLAFHGSLYNREDLMRLASEERELVPGLLRLYGREGVDIVRRLRGEFALAIWDGRERALYLATDRFRVHPLFYHHDAEKVVFSSRMPGILACSLPMERTVSPEAIADVAGTSIIPTPRTIFREVRKLAPGQVLRYRGGQVDLSTYWEISFLEPERSTESVLAGRLRAQLKEAVAVRLHGDGAAARIGTFLSGGVDSSTVTGLLTQLTGGPVRSFSIGFGERGFDELGYARIAARTFGARHFEYLVTAQDTYEAIPALVEVFDEPFANASAVPTYFCARLAREHGVEVLYAGDGGDELFAGNERYATQRLFDYYHRIPAWIREPVLKPAVYGLADALGSTLLLKGRKYIQRASIPYPERLSSYEFFNVVPMSELLSNDLVQSIGEAYEPYGAVKAHYHRAPALDALDRQLYVDLKLSISDNDLFKVTRTTEAAGIATRFPFLDHKLAEFAMAVPARMRMRGRQLRSFFKRAFSELLPPEVLSKKKHGFGLPIALWLRSDRRLNEMMRDLVLSPRSVQRGYFQKKALEELVERHRTDSTSFYGTALWNLMALELWHRRWC